MKPVPHAIYRICSKLGENDCAIAAMSIIFRRDYGEVLCAAARVNKHVWRSGLHCPDFIRVARRLGIKARWVENVKKGKFEIDEDTTGVLWVSYHDSTKEHVVAVIEGKVIDPEHTPASYWDYDEFCRANNAYGNSLLVVVE